MILEASDVLLGGRGLRLALPVHQDLAPLASQVRVARSSTGWAAPWWMGGKGGGAVGGVPMNFLRRPTWKMSCRRAWGGSSRR